MRSIRKLNIGNLLQNTVYLHRPVHQNIMHGTRTLPGRAREKIYWYFDGVTIDYIRAWKQDRGSDLTVRQPRSGGSQ